MATVIPYERCIHGRVMFTGEELACVQCGWRPGDSERLLERLERTSILAA